MKKQISILLVAFMVCCTVLSACSGTESGSGGVTSVQQETDSSASVDSEREAEKEEITVPADFEKLSSSEYEQLPNKDGLESALSDALQEIGVKETKGYAYGNYETIGPVFMIDSYVVTDVRNLIVRCEYLNDQWDVVWIDNAESGNMYYPMSGKDAYDYLTDELINPQEETESAGETPESEEEDTEPAEETPHRKGMYGISDRDVHDIDGTFSRNKVRNDVTGNWKISKISADVQMVDYALSYYRSYFYNDSEIHWIVNFYNRTTTCITTDGVELYVDVYEYMDGEEHDASQLGGGMLLGQYFVYLDNGDIEEIQ